jgi:acyl-coenzyme A thioesterase PaaI-like protein
MDPTATEGVSAFSGLKYFRALMEGTIARSAMLELFDINIEAAEPGLVVLTAIPTAEHYNPLGFVHGGYAAVLLDTCMAAAIVTSLEPRSLARHARIQDKLRKTYVRGYGGRPRGGQDATCRSADGHRRRPVARREG